MKKLTHISVLLLVLLLAACSGATAESEGDSDEMAAAMGDTLSVDTVQANLTLPSETGAVYMRIMNGSDEDDALIDAAVPGCDAVELHEMSMDGDVMRMRQVDGNRIEVPAGETVLLQQGGLHVMCIGKTGEFAVGDNVMVTLTFENAGTLEVEAEVVPPGEANMDMDGDEHGGMDDMDGDEMEGMDEMEGEMEDDGS